MKTIYFLCIFVITSFVSPAFANCRGKELRAICDGQKDMLVANQTVFMIMIPVESTPTHPTKVPLYLVCNGNSPTLDQRHIDAFCRGISQDHCTIDRDETASFADPHLQFDLHSTHYKESIGRPAILCTR